MTIVASRLSFFNICCVSVPQLGGRRWLSIFEAFATDDIAVFQISEFVINMDIAKLAVLNWMDQDGDAFASTGVLKSNLDLGTSIVLFVSSKRPSTQTKRIAFVLCPTLIVSFITIRCVASAYKYPILISDDFDRKGGTVFTGPNAHGVRRCLAAPVEVLPSTLRCWFGDSLGTSQAAYHIILTWCL